MRGSGCARGAGRVNSRCEVREHMKDIVAHVVAASLALFVLTGGPAGQSAAMPAPKAAEPVRGVAATPAEPGKGAAAARAAPGKPAAPGHATDPGKAVAPVKAAEPSRAADSRPCEPIKPCAID